MFYDPPVSNEDDKEQGDKVHESSFQDSETRDSLKREDWHAKCLGSPGKLCLYEIKDKEDNLRTVTVTRRRMLLTARRVISQSPGLAKRQTSNLNTMSKSDLQIQEIIYLLGSS